jgi:methanogenic corrinoid protein MtbC1
VSARVPAQRGNTPAAACTGPDAVERYLEQAVSGDGRAGVRLALDLIDSGVPAGEVIVSLLGPAQREVGERWLANR